MHAAVKSGHLLETVFSCLDSSIISFFRVLIFLIVFLFFCVFFFHVFASSFSCLAFCHFFCVDFFRFFVFSCFVWDVSRAHFYGEARRWIHTFLPKRHEQVGKLARLCRSMHGTRDAASIWGDTWSDVLKESSMKVGPRAQLSSAVVMEISRDCVVVMW